MMQTTLLELLIIFAVFVTVKGSHLEQGNSCIVQYLKNRNKLSQDFPYDNQPDSEKCKLVMPIILDKMEIALNRKLAESKEINISCIMEHLINGSVLDYLLIREIIPMSRTLDNSEIMQKTRNTTKILRRILITAAKRCRIDIGYYGLFDDILGLQNLSLPVLQQNYCYTKYVVDNRLIEVKHVNMNPRRIPTTNINCEEMIDKLQVTKERQLQSRLREKFKSEQVQCIMDQYRKEKAFDSNIALEVIDFLHVSYEEKRTNREKIADQWEKYIKSIFNCAKASTELQHKIGENLKILQF